MMNSYAVIVLNSITHYYLPRLICAWYHKHNEGYTIFIVRCCIYLTTYDWIKSFLKITIERRAIYGNLENKINTLYLAFIKIAMQTENYRRSVGGAYFCLVTITYLALELPRKSVKHSWWKKLSYCFKL